MKVTVEARRETGWQPFGDPATRAEGRFRFRYRFIRTRGVRYFRLRARVGEQARYPFARGVSRTVRVRVVGV